MTLFGIRVRIRLLSPIVFLLMIAFSGVQTVLPPLAALSVHELSHLLCAIALKARIDEIELMPFGAAMRLYALWAISPVKLMAIALSGPLANLIVCALMSLIVFFHTPLSSALAPFMYSSLLIALVNLLPALPLDGGRFLCALMAMKMKRMQAVKIGILLGRILGFFLILTALYAFVQTHRLPLAPILAGIYLIASGEQEKRHAEGAAIRVLLTKSEPAPPVRRGGLVMVQKGAPLLDAVNFARPGEDSLFAVTDDEGEILSLVTLKKVMSQLKENAAGTMDRLSIAPLHKIFKSEE